jgi:hypothetical protein
MKAFYLALSVAILVVFTACGGGGGSSNTDTPSSTASQTSSQTGSNSSVAPASSASSKTLKSLAAANGFLSQDTTKSLIDSLSILQGIASGAPKLRSPVALNICTSGSASFDYTASAITIIFNQCAVETSTMNGTMVISNTASTTPTYTFTNYTMVTDEGTIYLNATISASTTFSGSTVVSYDVTITGEMTVTEGSTVNRIVFTNYHAYAEDNAMTVNGTIEIDNDPEVCNSNGTYVVSTLSPITYDTNGNITGGSININGDVYTFHADGTVSVNGETYNLDELESSCVD